MTNSQLSTVLNICIRLLDAADDLGVDVTSIVKGKIDSEFNDKMFEVCGFGRENQRLPVLTLHNQRLTRGGLMVNWML